MFKIIHYDLILNVLGSMFFFFYSPITRRIMALRGDLGGKRTKQVIRRNNYYKNKNGMH